MEIMRGKTVLSGVAGIAVGLVLALLIGGTLVTVESSAMQTKSNGWFTYTECGKVGINILEQAVCAAALPGVNVPQEAMYWQAYFDGSGHRLNGQHDYILQFQPGGLPPNNAFWSVTMNYINHTMVNNPINRYWVSGTSGFVLNANGSLDIYIQYTSPAGHESNWLPAPTGDFLLFLRVYLPGQAILNGSYKVPPVVEVS
ncbi:MAG: DUF1214 domain-containing protein [Nitrososphaerota archaeon]|nr:DUF1214 domain-containing protein [Nitrososphaerota archaeon]